MVNTKMFPGSNCSQNKANTVNNAGGVAYAFPVEHELAQLAVTGTFNNTYYVTGRSQLDRIKELCTKCDPKFVAQLAVYSRKKGLMKDMPAYLAAYLTQASKTDPKAKQYLEAIFPIVINDGKMLRNYVQIVRSAAVGRKSFGRFPKRLICNWFTKDPEFIFRNSFGNEPTFKDIIKMIHPKGKTAEHNSLFKYLMSNEIDEFAPEIVKQYKLFLKGVADAPRLPFEVLATHIPASDLSGWMKLINNLSWEAIRMNLNTFQRKGLLENKKTKEQIIEKFKNFDNIKVFPYKLFTAYQNMADDRSLSAFKDILQDAVEYSTQNIPELGEGKTALICVDVSGSMSYPVTGTRKGSTTKTTCCDAAAVIAASLLRKNPGSELIMFDTYVRTPKTSPRDSIMTIAKDVSRSGGGTCCEVALDYALKKKMDHDVVIYISDNESWVAMNNEHYYQGATNLFGYWKQYKKKNPKAKMVLIDLTPNKTTQKQDDEDVLNIGGFSDSAFEVITSFLSGDIDTFANKIKEIEL